MSRSFLLTVIAAVLSTATVFAANIGQECKVPTSDPTYLCPVGTTTCLQAIGKKYCSNVGKVCGWPGTPGYTIGQKKQYEGLDYTCTPSGFQEVQPLPQIRQLTAAEKSILTQVFGGTLNTSQVRVTDTVGGDGRPWTTNTPPLYTINVGDAYPSLASNYKKLLVHEMTHVWQGQHGVPFMSNSAVHQTLAAIQNGGDPGQAYVFVSGKQWNKYNVEQQASMVTAWFWDRMSKTNQLYPYIRDNVRTGKPNAVTNFRK